MLPTPDGRARPPGCETGISRRRESGQILRKAPPLPPRDLDGRVAIVTGAGRGLGRTHAIALAARGARVVVNDLGVDLRGKATPSDPAKAVVEEIRASGGDAIASGHDIASWSQAEDLVGSTLSSFGDLHVLVNNAGILRDRSLHNLGEDEWDDVIAVHLKGHAAPTRHAFAYWRSEAKAGRAIDRSVVMTTSVSGLSGNFGQANYAAAKMGIVGLASVAAIEGRAIGVRANTVSPGARTRMALAVPGAEQAYDAISVKGPETRFDPMDPANVSGLVAWLVRPECRATGQVFHIAGDRLTIATMPRPVHELSADGIPWTPEMIEKRVPALLVRPHGVDEWNGFPDDFFGEVSRRDG